jgi:hypothetical protein
MISVNLEVTSASARTSAMVSIKLCTLSNLPGSLHLVRCFEFSCLHPHSGHLLMMFFSHNDSFKLQPHQPDTCLVINEQNVFG